MYYLQFIVHFLKKIETYLQFIVLPQEIGKLFTIYCEFPLEIWKLFTTIYCAFPLDCRWSKQVHFWNGCQEIRHTDLKLHKDLVCFWLAMCRNMLKFTFTMMCLFFVRKTKPFLYCFIPKLPGGTMKAVNSASKEIKELGRRSSDEKRSLFWSNQPTTEFGCF